MVRLRLCLLAQATITALDGLGSTTRTGTFGGQILKRWFVIGTTSRTAARKLVKNLKYAKTGLAIGALD